MGRYLIQLESQPGLASPELLDAVADHLDAAATVHAPALTIDPDTNALSFLFEVDAPDFVAAGRAGVFAAAAAIAAATGKEVDVDAELEVEAEIARVAIEPVAA